MTSIATAERWRASSEDPLGSLPPPRPPGPRDPRAWPRRRPVARRRRKPLLRPLLARHRPQPRRPFHHRGRQLHPPPRVLVRRHGRRGVEDHGRWHHLDAHRRRVARQLVGGGAGGGALRPGRGVGGDGRGRAPGQRDAGRRRVPDHGRRRDVDARRAGRYAGHRPHPRASSRTRTWRGWPPSAIPSGPTPSGACSARGTAGGRGPGSSSATSARGPWISPSIPRTRTSSTRRCGRCTAGRGSCGAAGRGRGSSSRRTAATPGRS